MINKILLIAALLITLSCTRDEGKDSYEQGNGNIWLSGGLAYCAEQIHLENGNTLIVNLSDVKSFKSGDRVTVKYKEKGISKSCPPGIDCEIIEIKKIE
jgi:hypothetical protein